MRYKGNRHDGINCSCIACSCLILPIFLTWVGTLFVFVGGVNGMYTMDIRAAIGIMIAVFNVFTFLLFCCDKARAEAGGFRVAELVLLYMVWFGSPLGGYMGICCLNHKTAKGKFRRVFKYAAWFNMLWVFLYLIITAKTSLPGAFKGRQ